MGGTSRASKYRQKRRLEGRQLKGGKHLRYNNRGLTDERICEIVNGPPIDSVPAASLTIPIETYGLQWGVAGASLDERNAMEQDQVPEEQPQIEVEVLPDLNGVYMADLWNAEQPETSQPAGGIFSDETMEMSQTDHIVDVNLGPVNIDDGSIPYDSRRGLDLTKRLANHRQDLSFRLWNLSSKHRWTNEALKDTMACMRMIEDISEAKSLPRTTKALHNKHHLFDVDYHYGQRCALCKCYKVWKYSGDSRNIVNKERKCCGKPMECCDEHFILLNPSQVFSLTLPSLHSKRKYEYLGPADKSKYDELELNFEENFSLTLNYDGVAVFKGSSRSMWPILATIDGLPAVEKKRNVLFLGAFFGQKKEEEVGSSDNNDENPPPEGCKKSFTDFMFDTILTTMEDLRINGFEWYDPASKKVRTSRCFITKVLCDSMGRPSVMGLMNLHGTFGCPCCYTKASRKGRYMYEEFETLELRTNEAHRETLARPDFAPNKPLQFRGIKYPSPFLKLKYFDLICGFPVDALHNVYLGVTKHLSCRWEETLQKPVDEVPEGQELAQDQEGIEKDVATAAVQPVKKRGRPRGTRVAKGRVGKEKKGVKGKKKTVSIPALLSKSARRIIASRLASVKPPHRVSRVLNSLEEAPGWKAHQWQMWLLYYSVPILDGLLPTEAMEHWKSLVYAIAILSQSCVTEEDIITAGKNLEDFCSKLTTVYPDHPKDYPFNFHLIRHLPAFCSLYGPLHNFSMDPFESYNSVLVGYVKGSQGAALQAAKGCSKDLITTFVEACSPHDDENNSRSSRSLELRMPLRNWVPPVGFDEVISPSDSPEFFQTCLLPGTGEKITSTAYTKLGMKRSADSAFLKNENVAVIEIFMRSSANKVFAVATEFMLDKVFPFTHIYQAKEYTLSRRLIPLQELTAAMLVIDIPERKTFYVRFLTGAENVHS